MHFEAANLFCAERNRLSQLPVGCVDVMWIGGGHPNQCFANAHEVLGSGEMSVVSGWLVTPLREHTFFVQHWWNYDGEKQKHVDRTPDIEPHAIYIADSEIALFAAEHNLMLKSCVCASVLVKSGGYWMVSMGSKQPIHIPDVKIETLFTNCWK